MTISYNASQPADATLQPPPAPWMPLGPLTELWAAFSREATSREALLATSEAFAALTAEREALHTLNWPAPSGLIPLTTRARRLTPLRFRYW